MPRSETEATTIVCHLMQWSNNNTIYDDDNGGTISHGIMLLLTGRFSFPVVVCEIANLCALGILCTILCI